MKTSTIGLVSGMGPLAGADILTKIIAYAAEHYGAADDADYPTVALYSHGIEGFNNQASTDKHFQKELIAAVKAVDKQQPTVVGIACNTAHLYLNELQQQTAATIVDLVAETAKAAANQPLKFMLLSSAETKKTGLYLPYLQEAGVDFAQTTKSTQAEIDKIIGLVMAYKLEEAGEKMASILSQIKKTQFNGVIAGCTELPLAITYASSDFGLKIISSNEVLAMALTDNYYQKKGVNNE